MDPLRTSTSTGADRAAAALRRVIDLAARVLRGLTLLAMTAAAATSVAWLAWVARTPPPDVDEWIVRIVVLAILLAPAAVLLLFVAGLRDLGRLPERTRALPADVRDLARELLKRSRSSRQRRGVVGVVVALFRLGRVVLGSREALSPYTPVTIALRPAILVAAFFAALAAVTQIPAAAVALLILSLT